MRSTPERKRDVLQLLQQNPSGWLATASGDGAPHVIAVSAWWDGDRLTVTTRSRSRTARNLEASRRARLVFGTPEDAILVDGGLTESALAASAPELATDWNEVHGWDPRDEPGDWAFYRFEPVRIQAYRGYDEHEGSDVMRDGRWLA